MSGIVERLTEGIVNRDMRSEGHALLEKWERTGLLEGLGNDRTKHGMARLLENQAKELLREATAMASGDVEGFAAVAFPIVRRVFAGLIANDLVSVQPMSLPSGLIFFLDFLTSADAGDGGSGGLPRLGYGSDAESLYGGGVVGVQLTGGVNLADNPESGPYALNNGYASATGSVTISAKPDNTGWVVVASGTVGGVSGTDSTITGITQAQLDTLNKLALYDPDLSGSSVVAIEITGSTSGDLDQLAIQNLIGVQMVNADSSHAIQRTSKLVRRCTQVASGSLVNDPSQGNYRMLLVFQNLSGAVPLDDGTADSMVSALTGAAHNGALKLTFPIDDNLTTSDALGSLKGTSLWALENEGRIPEIDIKVDSIAVTAQSKKLKAKWTPELGQDLNAYHNLDAEVELTSILSEQIALEIDREILEDLLRGATAGTYYWSRSPGLFVNRDTGAEIGASSAAPDFTGTVSEWYETLIETINDVSAQIHRKTLRGGANFVVCGPEVANILEFTSGFRASVTADDETGSIGAVRVGSLSKKFDVMVDPYFPRSLILVGRRGASFLESGYVYAPYVPLQTTPTIFGPEDFVPRKGVMTRYAKKMVRPDMYGLVVVRGLLGESGATS